MQFICFFFFCISFCLFMMDSSQVMLMMVCNWMRDQTDIHSWTDISMCVDMWNYLCFDWHDIAEFYPTMRMSICLHALDFANKIAIWNRVRKQC